MIRCQTTFCWTKFFGWRKYLTKTFFRFFGISGPAGSGKPDASQLGGSMGQEEPKDTSTMRIGPAVPKTHTSRYSYFNQIIKNHNALLQVLHYKHGCMDASTTGCHGLVRDGIPQALPRQSQGKVEPNLQMPSTHWTCGHSTHHSSCLALLCLLRMSISITKKFQLHSLFGKCLLFL